MNDSLDKVIDAAKKLRKYAKKSSDLAFVNLIADLNVELAELRVQLAESRTTGSTQAPPDGAAAQQQPQPQQTRAQQAQPQQANQPKPAPAGVTAQVDANFDSIFDDDTDELG